MADNEYKSETVVGIHMAGPNSGKTAMVVLHGSVRTGLTIVEIHGRIGNYGRHLSDERLIELLRSHHPLARVLVDVPLTVPPCVACIRPVCPGVSSCEDVAVNYMLALAERTKPRRQRRARPVNPQSQRLWDLLHFSQNPGAAAEPTYNSNIAPLATRARTFQRRVHHAFPRLELGETNISLSLQRLAIDLKLPEEWSREYRNFELGKATRRLWLDAFEQQHWVDADDASVIESMVESVELFQAFIAAMVGAFHMEGLVNQTPLDYDTSLGWVQIPLVKKSPTL